MLFSFNFFRLVFPEAFHEEATSGRVSRNPPYDLVNMNLLNSKFLAFHAEAKLTSWGGITQIIHKND